jgi:hypothetical protein
MLKIFNLVAILLVAALFVTILKLTGAVCVFISLFIIIGICVILFYEAEINSDD